MSQVQRNNIDKLTKNPIAKQVQSIKVGSLPKLQKDGVLTFSLPGLSRKLVVKAKRVEAKFLEDFEWYGEMTDTLGSVTILSNSGQV